MQCNIQCVRGDVLPSMREGDKGSNLQDFPARIHAIIHHLTTRLMVCLPIHTYILPTYIHPSLPSIHPSIHPPQSAHHPPPPCLLQIVHGDGEVVSVIRASCWSVALLPVGDGNFRRPFKGGLHSTIAFCCMGDEFLAVGCFVSIPPEYLLPSAGHIKHLISRDT